MNLNGGFPVILADPPWPYSNAQNNDASRGGTPYKQMGMERLCNMAPLIDKVAHKDCLLFLWATMPKLPEALQLMEAWKFKFVSVPFVWLKLNPTGEVVTYENKDVLLKGGIYSGMGYWTNTNVEVVLLGKRGKPKRDARNVKQVVFAPDAEVIVAPRGQHSAKPEEVRKRIEALTGNVPGLELFARGGKVKGWLKLGYEISGRDIYEDLGDIIGC